MLACSRQQASQQVGTMDYDVRGLADQIWMNDRRGLREDVSSIGAESPGLWSVSILEDFFEDAPVLKQTCRIGG